MVAVSADADEDRIQNLLDRSVEVYRFPANSDSLLPFLEFLAKTNITNLLVEGGGRIFGTFFDQHCVDEIYAFIAPKLIGGENAAPVIGGLGRRVMSDALKLHNIETEIVGGDMCLHGRIR